MTPGVQNSLSGSAAMPVRLEAGAFAATPVIRCADAGDLDAIHSVLSWWSEVGLTLPRSRADLERRIGSFSVAESDGALMACASLHIYDTPPGMIVAELRSVASTPAARGTGAASRVVEHCLSRAAEVGIPRLYLLSRAPGFFERRGFSVVRFRDVPAAFLEHALRRQGRTIAGRTCMARATGIGASCDGV